MDYGKIYGETNERSFMIINTKKKAYILFICFVISYIALAAYMVWATIPQSIETGAYISPMNMESNRVLSTVSLVFYFIPLSIRTKHYAQMARVKWIYGTMRYLLRIMVFFAVVNIISVIISLLSK